MLKKLIYIFFVIYSITTNAYAQTFTAKNKHASLTIFPEYTTLSATTKTITILAKADIKPNWHLYWDNPGDVGEAAIVNYIDTSYYQITDSIHSAPKKTIFEDIITSYIHKDEIYYKTTFTLTQPITEETLPFEIIFSYTACQKSCLPEEIKLKFKLPIKSKAEKNPSFLNTLLIAENTFPQPLVADISFQAPYLKLGIEEHILKDCQTAEFISQYPKKSILDNLPKTTQLNNNTLQVDFTDITLPSDFNGILLCPNTSYAITTENTSIEHHEEPLPPSIPTSNNTLWYYILTAFLAGLILNLMPCVLPILSLKALYLVQNHHKASIKTAFAYMAGVISSFVALASILFILHQQRNELGWGFQLQSPTFNLILLGLFIIIFLSLWDKLPIPTSFATKLNNLAGNKSFLTGFFAVLIACPCTGPFMGAAIGYAIIQTTPIYFSIFIALGIGYALPYTLIELFPKYVFKYIPKPGAWMITFKHILSLPIFLTCLWLGWVIFNQLYQKDLNTSLDWDNYTEEKVINARAKNQPVFINFTAKWCLVCLLNDKTTLSSKSFKTYVKRNNIKLFKADWTNRDETIGAALKSYNRNSIPLYIWYAPNANTPTILPQILTPEVIEEYLK